MSLSTEIWNRITRGAAEIISEAELRAKLERGKPLRIKLGVDPTAADLHLGHLVVLRKLKAFQMLGHAIEFIIGDFTARIGDPSGQSVTRPTLKPQEIWEHAKTYQDQVFRVLDREKTEVHYNSKWLNALGIVGLLELERRTSVAQMLERADFAERYAAHRPITLLEMMYPVLQGYDSVAVQADVELGGTDQKFNLLMGRELQQEYKQAPQVVMMMPLLEGLDGTRKMSKSYGNYVAFNDPPKEMFGKLMSIPDALMLKYVELLTDMDWSDIKSLHPRVLKGQISESLTAQFHGEVAAAKAKEEFERVFSKKEIPEDVEKFHVFINKDCRLSDLLAEAFGLSKNEVRRLLNQKAVEVDGRIAGLNDVVRFTSPNDRPKLVQLGKRRYIRFVPGA